MILSTSKQRQLIGFFRKTLKLQDDIYREILTSYHVDSSKKLTYEQASELLNNLKNKAISMGLYKTKPLKYDNMAARWGMATPKQLRYLEYLWSTVSNQPTLELKQKALNHFIRPITKKDHIKFLTQNDVSMVIKAIETMQKQQAQNKEIIYAPN
ncbi:DUF1018 domain-containing protein [bacterium]|nr:DUF1018 domain-containing protein [bacterium]